LTAIEVTIHICGFSRLIMPAKLHQSRLAMSQFRCRKKNSVRVRKQDRRRIETVSMRSPHPLF